MASFSYTPLRFVGALVLLVVVFGYTLFQARHLIRGPVVTIHTPQNGSTVSEPLLVIEGTTQNISFIDLNDRQIFVDEEGQFSEKLLLAYGYTIMTIRARDKFNRETTKTIELIYK